MSFYTNYKPVSVSPKEFANVYLTTTAATWIVQPGIQNETYAIHAIRIINRSGAGVNVQLFLEINLVGSGSPFYQETPLAANTTRYIGQSPSATNVPCCFLGNNPNYPDGNQGLNAKAGTANAINVIVYGIRWTNSQ